MNAQKQASAKRAWAELSERARLGEKFGLIACLGLFYKSGQISKEQVIQKLNEAGISREDLRKFRRLR